MQQDDWLSAWKPATSIVFYLFAKAVACWLLVLSLISKKFFFISTRLWEGKRARVKGKNWNNNFSKFILLFLSQHTQSSYKWAKRYIQNKIVMWCRFVSVIDEQMLLLLTHKYSLFFSKNFIHYFFVLECNLVVLRVPSQYYIKIYLIVW